MLDSKICVRPGCNTRYYRRESEGKSRFKKRRVCSRLCVQLLQRYVVEHGHRMETEAMDHIQKYILKHPAENMGMVFLP